MDGRRTGTGSVYCEVTVKKWSDIEEGARGGGGGGGVRDCAKLLRVQIPGMETGFSRKYY